MGTAMSSPRVLHVSLSDYRGGADIAARRIFQAGREAGVDARMAVRASQNPTDGVSVIPLSASRQRLATTSMAVASRVQKSSNPFHRSLNVIPTGGITVPGFSPDVVHLHWVGSNTLSLAEIQEIPQPVVWTLHDSWPFAGAEHHPSYPADRRFIEGYQRRNRVDASRIDVDGWIWGRKRRTWERRFYLTAPSTWMADQARSSVLMSGQPIVVIPNPVEPVQPRSQLKSRDDLGISPDAFVVVTAGIGGVEVSSKGWGVLRNALQHMAVLSPGVHLVIIGQEDRPQDIPAGVECTVTGRLTGSHAVARAMACGDIFVTSSTVESFGLAAAEASAMGIPVVAPAATGLLDVVVDGETGWTFPAGNDQALTDILVAAKNDPHERQRRGNQGRLRAETLWSPQVVGQQYRDLYESVLKSM